MAAIKHIIRIVNDNDGERLEFSGARAAQLKKARRHIKCNPGEWTITAETFKGAQRIDFKILKR